MSELTQNQEELAKAYILHHGNRSDAWRACNPKSKAAPESVWVSASRAFDDSMVQLRIQELQDMATERHLVTVGTLTDELDENRKVAKDEKQAAAMTASTVAKAKLHGLMTDKIKHTGVINLRDVSNMSEEELEAELKE